MQDGNVGSLEIARSDDTWISAVDAQHQRHSVHELDGESVPIAKILVTHDGWQTLDNAAPDPISPPVVAIIAPVSDAEDKIILGATAVSESQPYHVLAMVGETSVAPVGLSDDIPYAAGGICLNGIQVIA
jgi:hypothetical protein